MNNVFLLWQFWMLKGLKASLQAHLLSIFPKPLLLFDAPRKILLEIGVPSIHISEWFCVQALSKAEEHVMRHLQYDIEVIIPDVYVSSKGVSSWPRVLYKKGHLDQFSFAAVIGTRRMSKTGALLTESVCRKWGKEGYTILGGLSEGVELRAHSIALELAIPTVAVVPFDLSKGYPRSVASVGNQIERKGAVLSPFPIGATFLKHSIPQRNDVMMAISQRVGLIEAPLKSGAVKLGRLALEKGKDVYALKPKVVCERSLGNQVLLGAGALPLSMNDFRNLNGQWDLNVEMPYALKGRVERGFVRGDVIGGELGFEELLQLQSEGWVIHRRDGRWEYCGWSCE